MPKPVGTLWVGLGARLPGMYDICLFFPCPLPPARAGGRGHAQGRLWHGLPVQGDGLPAAQRHVPRHSHLHDGGRAVRVVSERARMSGAGGGGNWWGGRRRAGRRVPTAGQRETHCPCAATEAACADAACAPTARVAPTPRLPIDSPISSWDWTGLPTSRPLLHSRKPANRQPTHPPNQLIHPTN